MFSFSVHSWRNQMDTAGQKYKYIEVAVEEPKWAQPEEMHCCLCVSRRSIGGWKHLAQYHNTLWHMNTSWRLTLCACMRACKHLRAFCFHYVQPVAASFISLIPSLKHYDGWRSTDQYQSLSDSGNCFTTLLETTEAREEKEKQRKKKKCVKELRLNNVSACDREQESQGA